MYKFGIVGLGLMGGSFAKVIKKYNLSSLVVGYDHNKEHQKQALELGLVQKIVDLDGLKDCDIIVLAIPVDASISFLNSFGSVNEQTTIIDFGGTKELIVNNIPTELKDNFIAGHPMTGTEKFGPKAAIDGLYEDKIMVLCDLENSKEFHKKRIIKIFETIKMKLVFMKSKDHDRHACYMSHLPHAISFALANVVMNQEDPNNIISLAAGGFKDMSRIAKSSPLMWADIFKQNRKNLLESIYLYEEQFALIKKMVEDEDYDSMIKWMGKANTLHDIL